MSQLFKAKVRGSTVSEKLHYEIGYLDRNGIWRMVVVSGDLYKTFWEADQAAISAVAAVDRAYRTQWVRKQYREQEYG